jgi:hypothetical protein
MVAALALAVLVAGRPALAQEPPPRDAILAEADAVLARITAITGLEPRAPIARDVESRETLRASVAALVADEYDPAELAALDRFLELLGVLTPEQDYLHVMLDLLQEQVAGYYDPDAEVLFLIDDLPLEMQRAVMSHELHHAVQDQHFDIEAVQGWSRRMTDLTLARSALLEGDALLVMLAYTLGDDAAPWDVPMLSTLVTATAALESPQNAVPAVLWDQLLLPYTAGLGLVVERGRAGGWPAIHAVYADPPDSTEQVLHPGRFVARDEPTLLAFDAGIAGERYQLDVLGEATIASLLRQVLAGRVSTSACTRAAEGWDGDRAEAWALDGGGEALVWVSVWDSVDEAVGFFRVAGALDGVWVGAASEVFAGPHGERRVASSPGRALLVERWGDAVAVVFVRGRDAGDALDVAALANERAWATLTRWAYPE